MREAGDRTFELLATAVGEAQAVGRVRAGDPSALALAAWSVVHGLATLLVDGRLGDYVRSAEDAERVAVQVTTDFMLGLAPR